MNVRRSYRRPTLGCCSSTTSTCCCQAFNLAPAATQRRPGKGLASLDRASLEADLAEKQAALDQAELTLERALKRRGRLRPGRGRRLRHDRSCPIRRVAAKGQPEGGIKFRHNC